MPRCPSCFTPMTRIEEQGLRAHICGRCRGTWIAPVTLLRRVRMDIAATQPAPPASSAPAAPPAPPAPTQPPPIPAQTPAPAAANPLSADSLESAPSLADLASIVAQSDSRRSLRCPECEKPMTKSRFQQMIPVSIDRCKHCERIWLDRGEYNLIRRLYVEMMLSTDPQIVALREKIAHATAAWETRTTASASAAASAASVTGVGFTLNTIVHMLTS